MWTQLSFVNLGTVETAGDLSPGCHLLQAAVTRREEEVSNVAWRT